MSKRRQKQQRTPSVEPRKTGMASFALLASGILIVTAFVFFPVVHAGFVTWDDGPYVFANPMVLGGLSVRTVKWAFTNHTPYWHPVTWISHLADVTLLGPEPQGMHAMNLAIHLANVLLLFVGLTRLTSRVVPAALVTALFALHPLHVESVAWIAERKDLLSTFFFLAALNAYVAYAQRPGRLRYAGVAIAFALSLMCKPMFVTLPVLLLLLDYWPLARLANGPSLTRLCLEKVPLALLSIPSMIVTYVGQERTGTVSKLATLPLPARAANASVACAAYLRKTVWPSDLAAFYPYPDAWPMPAVAVSVAVLLALTTVAIALRRRMPYLLFGWLWYLVSLLPVIGFIQVGNQSMADRFTYVPLVGIFVMIAWAADEAVRGPRARMIAVAAAVVVLIACATVARAQVYTWSSSTTMWSRVLEVSPDSVYAHSALGAELADQGDLQAARAQQEEALRLRPSDPDAHNELGKLDAERGDLEHAIRHFSAAAERRQDFGEAFHNLGTALLHAGRPADAVAPLRRAVDLLPADAGSYNGLGLACARVGNLDEARIAFEKAAALDPASAEYRSNLDAVKRLRDGR